MSGPPAPPRRRRRLNYPVHLALFAAACFTTTWAGTQLVHPELDFFRLDRMLPFLGDGLPYSLSIMGILLAHEMGHYLMARWYGVDASLPYFLPVPLPMSGTMGAVIVMRGKISSRNALVDWAAAGPLAGLVVAVPVLFYGVHLAPLGAVGPGLLEGNSLLYLGVKYLVKGQILPGNGLDIQLNHSPVAWAGWLGLLVTMINLMPIGQLDGGHIAFAYAGDRYGRISRWLHRALIPLGVGVGLYVALDLGRGLGFGGLALGIGLQAGFPWLLWGGLLQLFRRLSGGRYHPPVGEEELGAGRRRLCVVMLVIFALICVPIPMRQVL